MSSGKRSHKHVSKDDGSEGAGGPEDTPRAEGNAGSILAPCLNCSKPHIYARDRKACDSRYALSAALFLAAGGIYGGAMPNGDLTHPEWLFLRRAGDLFEGDVRRRKRQNMAARVY